MYMFEVICKCGHVGRNYYIPISFPVKADNGKEAAYEARYKPRVKHHQKDAILSVRKITYNEYIELIRKNSCDMYLLCKNVQEQRFIDLSNRLVREPNRKNEFWRYEEREVKCFLYKKRAIRNPKKYFKNLFITENYMEENI